MSARHLAVDAEVPTAGDSASRDNLPRPGRRERLACLVPLLLGVMFGISTYAIIREGELNAVDITLYVLCLLFCTVFVACFRAARRAAVAFARALGRGAAWTRARVRGFSWLGWSPRALLLCTLLIFALWLPYLVALRPGVLWMDSSSQVLDIVTRRGTTNSHHPILDTILIGGAARMGLALAGDAQSGLYLLVLVQSLAMAAALALQVCYFARVGVPARVCVGVGAFFALFPAFPLVFVTLCKDTLSAPFFVVFCVMYEEVVRTRGKALASAGWVAGLAASAALLALTKKPAPYLVAGSLVPLLVCGVARMRRAREGSGRAVVAVAAVLVLAMAANPVMERAFTLATGRAVVPGGKQEALAVPLQQVANVVRTNAESLSPAERETIDNTYLMGFEGIPEVYAWRVADGVKRYEEAPNASYRPFVMLWLSLCVREPGACFSAWVGLVADWFSFVEGPNMVYAFDSSWTDEEYQELVGGRVDTALRPQMEIFAQAVQGMPVLGVLFQKCVWASIVPALCLYLALVRRGREMWRGLLRLVPLLLSVGVLLVGPGSCINEAIRYVLPLMCTAPLYLLASLQRE